MTGIKNTFSDLYFQYATLITFSNSCVNPFIYILQYEAYQTAGKQLMYRMWACLTGTNCKDNTPPTDTPSEDRASPTITHVESIPNINSNPV